MKHYLVLEDWGEAKKGSIVSEIDDETILLGRSRFHKESALDWKIIKEVKIKIIE